MSEIKEQAAVASLGVWSGLGTLIIPVIDHLSSGALGPKGIIAGMLLGSAIQLYARIRAKKQITGIITPKNA